MAQSLILWKHDWKGEIIFSEGDSNARGVSILVHPKSEVKSSEIQTDSTGRLICLKIQINDRTFTLANIYGPNEDKKDFYLETIQKIEDLHDTDCTIVGGDFNLVMEPGVDRFNSDFNNYNSATVLKEYMSRVNLQDVWRIRNPAVKQYTWHRKSRGAINSCSRLDMF